MSLVKNLAQTFGSKMIAIVLSFITSVFLTRLLGPEGRGVFAYISTNVMLLTMLMGFSMTRTMAYFAASGSTEKGKNLKLGVGVAITLLSILLFSFIIYLLYWQESKVVNYLIPEDYQTTILLLFLVGSFAYQSVNNYLTGVWQGSKQFSVYNYTVINERVISVAVFGAIWFFGLFSENEIIQNVFLTLLAIYGIDLLIKIFFFLKLTASKIGFSFLTFYKDPSLIKSVLAFGSVGMAANVLNFANRRLDIWFIEYYQGMQELGYYALSARLSDILLVVLTPALQVLLPYFNTYSEEKGLELLSFCTRIGFWGALIAFIVLILLGPYVIPLLYGAEFINSIFPFQLLCVGLFFMFVRNIYTVYNVAINQQKINLWGNAIGLLLTIVFDFLLIPDYGVIGACIASIIAYFVSFVFIVGSVVLPAKKGIAYFFIPKRKDFAEVKAFIVQKTNLKK
ncbi:oligosaccharide flippase family protein [Neolewinella agarilytica]|uniref:oligosaccharide flippase family protein n=1 Tax=Neolewinella agarilytica TaxID=478744 RepID=UPI002354D4D6|nr:oligosaccharide flippase family protein [Neolewinella agarilytica]